jgi:16S rRNA (adenine1518-N6/adenine1519-N6)-dimethyltransferase
MIEPSVYERMLEHASLTQDDTVLDIGAGFGFLTYYMANECKTVFAVEADAQLASILREQLRSVPNVKIIEGNVLKVDIPFFNKVVSTPPYSISSRLLLWILNRDLDRSVLVFQKEFAHRLVAPIGSQEYGWLTVLTYFHAQMELLDEVPRSMFYPTPKVDSVIIRLTPWKVEPFAVRDETIFKRLVQTLFAERNKKIRSGVLPFIRSIKKISKHDAVRIAEGLPLTDKRARDLAPEDFGALANACDI